MEPIESTYEVLALKVLGRNFDDRWIIWAIDMLMAGFDTEHLRILAGAEKPYNQFYFHDLTEKVLSELNFDYSDPNKTISNYALFLISQAIDGKKDILTVLSFLRDVHMERYSDTPYQDFYYLCYAKQDLLDSDVQWYWPDANRDNIDKIILEKFKSWKAENDYSSLSR